jgi:hypothetical protein
MGLRSDTAVTAIWCCWLVCELALDVLKYREEKLERSMFREGTKHFPLTPFVVAVIMAIADTVL